MERNNEILIFGNSWLGIRLQEYLNCNIILTDITNYENIQSHIDTYKPKVIINCIDRNFNKSDDYTKDISKNILNLTYIPLLLAEAAVRNSLKFVNISCGSVFNYDHKKDKPITEEQFPDDTSTLYSRTRIYTEVAINALGNSANILQLRVHMPLDFIPHPKNLLSKLLTYSSVIDVPNSVTYVPDFLEAAKQLLKEDAEGIYNIVTYGELRFKELLEEYRKFNPNHAYAIMDVSELKKEVSNVVLSSDKIEEFGIKVRDIHEILPECVQQYVDIVKSTKQQLL